MKRPGYGYIGLDSQCLSYLLDAIAGIAEPTGTLAEEMKALLRIWFYRGGTYILTETVVSEVAAIRKADRREFHDSFINTLFLTYSVGNAAAVQIRAEELFTRHGKMPDCRILAEAEELELESLLTYDTKFLSRLAGASPATVVESPSSYWVRLGIPKGAKPVTIPHPTNPLSQQSWWRC